MTASKTGSTRGAAPQRPTSLPVVTHAGWRLARVACVAGLAVVLAGFFVFPDTTSVVFWWGIVPLLPVVFLIHPSIWRNVCPLATLGMGREPDEPRRGAASGSSPWAAGAAGILPFVLLVAWRGTGLESRPLEAGGLLIAVTVFAVVTGRRGIRRNGFCNRFCPLLPIERTYGQSPLAEVEDSRCGSCTLCTPRGCLDLSATSAAPQLLGPGRRGSDWLRTPFGAFVAALPGFIAAYFVSPAAGSTSPADVLAFAGALVVGSVVSWTAVRIVVGATRASWAATLPTLAAVAAVSYYLFAMPRAEEAWGWAPIVTPAIQAVVALVVALWWVRAVRSSAGPKALRMG